MLWCRKKTAGYREIDPPGISNFTTSFKNGLAFCALIHKFQPHLIDYDSLQPGDAVSNLELAFSVAEQSLSIPRLLDIEDMTQDKPDERSVMTYVAEYFHRFAALEQKEASARRAAKFLSFIRRVDSQKRDYETQAQTLLQWISSIITGWESEQFGDNLEDAQTHIDRLRQFVLHDEPEHAALKLDLEALYAEIQTQLRVNGRATYDVPSDVSPDAIEAAFHQLYLARQAYARKSRDHRYQFIQKQETSVVNEEQIKEFQDAFDHFDTDRDGRLSNKDEFKAALSAVGVNVGGDAELAAAYTLLSEGSTEGVARESFVNHLIALREDKDTPEQIKASFKQLANDNATVTVDDLNIAPLSREDAEYIASLMPKTEDGRFDYNAFVDSQYSQTEAQAAS